jgi:GDP/UDP-N,N'-diacetylbacillosamine 2-epimerase (hydrolysing)
MKMTRKILVLTGKRGGYGAMKPMLRLLRDDLSIELQLVVTDQHLNPRFGKTILEIEQEFVIAEKVDIQQDDDSAYGRSVAMGQALIGMSRVFASLKPDICVLYGDRGEVLAAAQAATVMGIPIAHLQGGDVSGSVDEQVRHAVTKLSHIHFPSTEESKQRILGMGEESERIHAVGDNHIDLIIANEFLAPEEVARQLSLDLKKPILVVLQHSETTNPQASHEQMMETLSAVQSFNLQTVIVYPCSDVGYEGVISAINKFRQEKNFYVHKNLDAQVFWGLLNIASVFIGNSSAGIIEAPVFKLPVINVGRRQESRQCAENVIQVNHSTEKIRDSIDKALADQIFIENVKSCQQIYGDGKAGERIVDVLTNIKLGKELMIKRMTF